MNRRFLSFILIFVIVACTACTPVSSSDVQAPRKLGADHTVSAEALKSLKSKSAVGVFCSSSNGYDYEWTIFGSDIGDVREDICLQAVIQPFSEKEGLSVTFPNGASLGFSAVLSVYTGSKWNCGEALIYKNSNELFTSASVTGAKETVISFSLSDLSFDISIVPHTAETPVPTETDTASPTPSNYLSVSTPGVSEVYSGTGTLNQDKYLTDPVPQGKPLPIEPDDTEISNAEKHSCTFSIECSALFNNLAQLDPSKLALIPDSGKILSKRSVTFYEGESVFDVLQRVCRENSIHLESSWTPVYNSAYVEGINNLYEFDCGSLSGWMYRVNGWYPNYGCSRYKLREGDIVEWRYTCDLGKDIGSDLN